MGDIKIKYQCDTSEFERNTEKFLEEVKSSQEDMLRKAATFFATAAAKFTPPSIGKNTIDKAFYNRPIQKLSQLIADGEATSLDQIQYKAGKKYKVVNTKKNNGTAYAYCSTASEAKKLSKIANRGLARVMWGKALPSIGVNVPSTIRALMRKSPNLESLDYSSATINTVDSTSVLEIENSSINIEKFANFAASHGEDNAQKGISLWARNFARQNKEL